MCADKTFSPPVVLVPSCLRTIGRHPFQVAGQKYLEAVRLAGGMPMVVPGATPQELDALLAMADGLLLTGSPSNVHPSHFDEAVHDLSLPLDPARDAWTLPIIRRAVALGLPVLGICRGFQEVNVALGGSLHQAVHAQPGLLDHRSEPSRPVEEEYGLAHAVELVSGGWLETILQGLPPEVVRGREIWVNSLHGQGVKRLADGLRVDAVAPDGVVEAFSHGAGATFCVGLQWHPEWLAASNPVSLRIFMAFGQACQAWQSRKLQA